MMFTPHQNRRSVRPRRDGRPTAIAKIICLRGVNDAAQSAANIVKGRHEPILALGAYLGRSQVLESALSEPARNTHNCLPHFLGRARVGKADELTASNRVEIDPGCRR